MATAEVPLPIVNSAQQSEPGTEKAIAEQREVTKKAELLSPQYGAQYPPSNVFAEFLRPDQLPNPRPSRVLFAALRDPRLRMVCAIPLNVTVEESTVVVCWSEINEFGTGETLSVALDDFAGGLRELYHRLFTPAVTLGPDLLRVKQTLGRYIQPQHP